MVHGLPFILLLLVYGSLAVHFWPGVSLSFYWGATMPLMLCPHTSRLVLISPTSKRWQAESTPPGVNSAESGFKLRTLRSQASHPRHEANNRLSLSFEVVGVTEHFLFWNPDFQHISGMEKYITILYNDNNHDTWDGVIKLGESLAWDNIRMYICSYKANRLIAREVRWKGGV